MAYQGKSAHFILKGNLEIPEKAISFPSFIFSSNFSPFTNFWKYLLGVTTKSAFSTTNRWMRRNNSVLKPYFLFWNYSYHY